MLIEGASECWVCHSKLWYIREVTLELQFIFFFNISFYSLGCVWSLLWHAGTWIASYGISMPILSCGMWDLVPWSGVEPGPPSLRAWSLSHWTTREVLSFSFLISKWGWYLPHETVVKKWKNICESTCHVRNQFLPPHSLLTISFSCQSQMSRPLEKTLMLGKIEGRRRE